jgi:hypothetical protein
VVGRVAVGLIGLAAAAIAALWALVVVLLVAVTIVFGSPECVSSFTVWNVVVVVALAVPGVASLAGAGLAGVRYFRAPRDGLLVAQALWVPGVFFLFAWLWATLTSFSC